jgi:Mrp family chromosome partitioning ATPase
MARWKPRKNHTLGRSEGGALQVEEPVLLPRPVQTSEAVGELLGLHAALEQMAHLSAVAEPSTPAHIAPAPRQPLLQLPGEVTEAGEARLIRITNDIQALIEPDTAPADEQAAAAAAAPEEEPSFASSWLPADCRGALEVLSARCPSHWADSLRKLRGRLLEERTRWEAAGRRLSSVAIASPRRAGGRSATARNLAACLGALPDARVLLVDADVGRPSLHRRLRLSQSPGLTEALGSERDGWRAYIRRVPDSGLYVLPLGAAPAGMDPIDPQRFPALLDRLRADFAWIIVDAPPMETADGETMTTVTDATVLVLHNNREYFDEAEAAVRRIDPSRLLGAILNFA